MKECKIRESGIEATSIEFVNWFIEQLKTNCSNFVKKVENTKFKKATEVSTQNVWRKNQYHVITYSSH